MMELGEGFRRLEAWSLTSTQVGPSQSRACVFSGLWAIFPTSPERCRSLLPHDRRLVCPFRGSSSS